MKHKPFKPKAAQENRKDKVKLVDATKIVSFKKKSFEFKASTMEGKKGTFNQETSFSNPNKKEMYLFVEKFSWDPTKALMDGVIKISVSYAGAEAVKLYNSKIVPQSTEGKRNINLTYTIKEGAEIKVSFECRGFDIANPNYGFVYKWLDPQLGKDSKGHI
jgi:hypothetical protein